MTKACKAIPTTACFFRVHGESRLAPAWLRVAYATLIAIAISFTERVLKLDSYSLTATPFTIPGVAISFLLVHRGVSYGVVSRPRRRTHSRRPYSAGFQPVTPLLHKLVGNDKIENTRQERASGLRTRDCVRFKGFVYQTTERHAARRSLKVAS